MRLTSSQSDAHFKFALLPFQQHVWASEDTTEVVKSCDKWLKLRFPHNALSAFLVGNMFFFHMTKHLMRLSSPTTTLDYQVIYDYIHIHTYYIYTYKYVYIYILTHWRPARFEAPTRHFRNAARDHKCSRLPGGGSRCRPPNFSPDAVWIWVCLKIGYIPNEIAI